MILLNLAKRLLPFFATFMLGLFIASFFVTLSAPTIRYKHNYEPRSYEYNKSCWNQKKHRDRTSRSRDLDQLTNDAELRGNGEINFDAVAPVAPDAPTMPRHNRR